MGRRRGPPRAAPRRASIRPRLYYRGNHHHRLRWQWRWRWLQFGHGFITVEMMPAARCPTVSRPASIRPRLYYRGNCSSDYRGDRYGQCFNSATALLPWKSQLQPGAVGYHYMLQFGHGFITVEICLLDVLHHAHIIGLQFGHGFITVEIESRKRPSANGKPASIRPRFYYRGNGEAAGA